MKNVAAKQQPPSTPAGRHAPAEYPIGSKEAMAVTGLTKTPFYAAIKAHLLPAPFYPAPRAPRWYASELRAALERTRAQPTDQMNIRRQRRIADEQVARAS